MRKHILPYFLFLLLACACSLNVHAKDVFTLAELTAIAEQSATSDFAGQTIDLKSDLDLDGAKWTPIGTKDKPFKGTFNGNGHTIKGIRAFNGTDGVGLFGYVAKEAVIRQLGISGGALVAPNKRRVGAIAGVCDGKIEECWSMAEVAVAGTVVGGLVGELTANGTIVDCYHAGVILNSSDTIGGIVGLNSGKLERVYNIGYARRGKAIVGADKGGKYADCHSDRKLYYQPAGATNNGIVLLDKTEEMFEIFQNQPAWNVNPNAKRYPMLKAFETLDASLLSVAPLFIDTMKTDTIDHANELTKDFLVSIDGGIEWACQSESDKDWIQIDGAKVKVIRPCTETEVLVNATLNNELRVVYLRPRRLEDFESGGFGGDEQYFCFNEDVLLNTVTSSEPADKGWPATETDPYYYRLVLFGYDEAGKEIFLKDLVPDDKSASDDYELWLETAMLPTDSAGDFVVRRYAHDSKCVTDWKASTGEFKYHVYEEFKPGEIESNEGGVIDTIYLPDTYIANVKSITNASGGGGPITYEWFLNSKGGKASGQTDSALVDYELTKKGVYVFTRAAKDSAECYKTAETNVAEGTYTVVVFDPFNPGKVNPDGNPHKFCTPEDAKAFVIKATSASGGDERNGYIYQWYLVNGTDTTAIEGATEQNLDLSDFPFEPNTDYTFVRKAKDKTRFTVLTTSYNEQNIHIMSAVTPGAIQDGKLENFCVDSAHYSVKVEETTAATSSDEVEYKWYRISMEDGDSTDLRVNNKDLEFTIRLDMLNKTFRYVRYVRNVGCPDWHQSAGMAEQSYGMSSTYEYPFIICDTELPYTLELEDGSKHTFKADGEKYVLIDSSKFCPDFTIYSVKTAEKPDFRFDSVVNYCQESSIITIEYDKTAGEVDTFRISYSADLARYMGRNDTTGRIEEQGIIFLRNVPQIGTGDNHLFLELGYNGGVENGICFSKSHAMQLIVNIGGYVYSKYDRMLFVDNNPNNDLLPNVTEKLEFKSYQWYKNGVKIEGATGQYYHEDGALLVGEYFCLLTDTKDRHYRTCSVDMPKETTSAAPQHSTVYPIPVGVGEPITIECNGQAQIISFTGEFITAATRVEGQAKIQAPRVAGMYYVQITTAEGITEIHKLIVK